MTAVADLAAVRTTEDGEVTGEVVIVKEEVVDPACTIVVAGGTAQMSLEESSTSTPPVGAGPLSVTVPVEALPPRTLGGDSERPTRTDGLIERLADTELPFTVAVIVADWVAATGVVAIEN